MAKAEDGLFGKLSGKIGDVVFSSWKGIPYVKSKPSGNSSNTKAQQNQRSKFKIVISFINDIKPVINAGFKWNIDRMTEMNSATSYIMKNAVKGEKPELEIDYPSVLVARGTLPGPQEAAVSAEEENVLRFSWSFDTNLGIQRGNDHVLALAYHPEQEQGVWVADGSILRKEEQLELRLPNNWAITEIAPYLAFATSDGSDASDSVYLGEEG